MVKSTPCSKCKKLISNNYLKRHEATCKGDNVVTDDDNELSVLINEIADNIDNGQEPEVPENVESTEVETNDSFMGIVGGIVFLVMVGALILVFGRFLKNGDDSNE
ncbi:MAG: hypothetical protein KAJ03_10795 [Gammaproteobacteria bacterium]|nr:hypothetical protein [Gammaproteobacteria bacterium]